MQKFATKEKTQNNVGEGGGRGVIQLFNAQFSPNYVSFTSTKVKCTITLLGKYIYIKYVVIFFQSYVV